MPLPGSTQPPTHTYPRTSNQHATRALHCPTASGPASSSPAPTQPPSHRRPPNPVLTRTTRKLYKVVSNTLAEITVRTDRTAATARDSLNPEPSCRARRPHYSAHYNYSACGFDSIGLTLCPPSAACHEQALVSLKLKKSVDAERGRTFAVIIEGGYMAIQIRPKQLEKTTVIRNFAMKCTTSAHFFIRKANSRRLPFLPASAASHGTLEAAWVNSNQ